MRFAILHNIVKNLVVDVGAKNWGEDFHERNEL